ncbi:hypothetical protein BJV82DRAFT_6468 [Fennellomyces sp. T-0311]|nr:hypothetical protein BJV82DRAFT_6468 [Fennellomyces sp. T-0311]
MVGDSISFPIHTLHVNPMECAFTHGDKTIDKHNLPVTSMDMTQQLVALLDNRAHALGVQGKFEAAVKVAQQIIVHMPTLSTGYIRIANLYRMQGMQRHAIDAYAAGLHSVSPDDPRYLHLGDGMAGAKQQAEKRIDFVGLLPVEIVEDIVTLLPTEYRLRSLQVSKTWRKKVLECARAWRECNDYDVTDASMIAQVAPHVKHLTIGTGNEQTWSDYLISIMEGHFTKIRSFHLTVKFLPSKENIDSTMVALSRMDSTLTKLELNLGGTQNTPITLSHVLLAFPRLKSLIYTTTSRLVESIGNTSLLDENHELVDMELDSKYIAGKDILPLLQKCRHMRRLLLNGCNTTVLHAVDMSCPALEILGYNTRGNHVPELTQPTRQRTTFGLREFYTKNGSDPEFAAIILPLIRKNMATLKTVYMNISAWGLHELSSMYADLRLDSVDKLTFWGDDSGIIQPLILRSISSCTTLSHLSVSASHDIPGLVDALTALPRLESLELSHIWSSVGCTYLVRLFDAYAEDTRNIRPFRTISLGYCYVVTDAVLAALSKIRSLENITLSNLRNVSTRGIDAFMNELSNTGTANISLIEMDSIMDDQLIALGKMERLRSINLDELKNVTDYGITEVVNEAQVLRKLTLTRCNSVTLRAIAHAKQKIKAVVVNE